MEIRQGIKGTRQKGSQNKIKVSNKREAKEQGCFKGKGKVVVKVCRNAWNGMFQVILN